MTGDRATLVIDAALRHPAVRDLVRLTNYPVFARKDLRLAVRAGAATPATMSTFAWRQRKDKDDQLPSKDEEWHFVRDYFEVFVSNFQLARAATHRYIFRILYKPSFDPPLSTMTRSPWRYGQNFQPGKTEAHRRPRRSHASGSPDEATLQIGGSEGGREEAHEPPCPGQSVHPTRLIRQSGSVTPPHSHPS